MQLLWFWQDLRDHQMLAAAAVAGDPFVVIDSWFYDHPEIGSLWIRFLFDALWDLTIWAEW